MSIAVLGEALIDFILGDDGAYRPHLGGSPFNVAMGLARQGIEVSYLSPFSDDTFGQQLYDALRAEGVQVPLARRSLWPTSLALVTVDENGMPTYRLYREGIADKDTTCDEVRAHLPANLKVFHTGSLAITPSQLPKIFQIFAVLRERGVLISVDINIRLRASIKTDEYIAGVRSVLREADIVKASDEDLAALEFADDPMEAARLAYAEMGSGLLVLTEGRGGAVLFSAGGIARKASYPIAQVADSVGAGDTFHGAFLAALMRSHDSPQAALEQDLGGLSKALDFACAAAAINVSRVGCSPPTFAEVKEFIRATQR